MPGGVPHWVLGTSNAICVGRHFYGASTICSSVIAIAHTFLMAGSVTNGDLLETRTLLYQLMVFWSTRIDVTDVDGESFVKCYHLVLIWLWLRGAYPGPFSGGGTFRHLIPWCFHHPLTGFRQPVLPNEISTGQRSRRSCPCDTPFPLPASYLLNPVYPSPGRRGCVVILFGGPDARRVRCCCCQSFEGD